MSLLQAVVLALVQGATEFLPISSSAHLVLVPWLLGWPDQGLAFDVAVNTGTLLAVVIYLRRELAELVKDGLGGLREPGLGITGRGRLAWGIALGTVPVAVAGLVGYDFIAGAARSPAVIAATTIGFGLALGWADRVGSRRMSLEDFGLSQALLIGLAQAVALVPGTSRSGITMTAALLLGFRRTAAARFSFLLYVPVGILAAGHDGLELLSGRLPATELPAMLVGAAVAAVTAYLVMGWLLAWLERRTMTPFVLYRLALGLVIIALLLAH